MTKPPASKLRSYRRVPYFANAVAYYRDAPQYGRRTSLTIQQKQVRRWAEQRGVAIVNEFIDHDRSRPEGQSALTDLMENWVKGRQDFKYVLCLDASRWGRDIDLAAQAIAECERNGIHVIFTSAEVPSDDDPLYALYVQFERWRAAKYSRNLWKKLESGNFQIVESGKLLLDLP